MHSKYLISSSWRCWVRPAASAAGPGAASTLTRPPTPVCVMMMVLSLQDGPWGLSWWESPAARTGSEVATGSPWHTASGAAWSAGCVGGCMVVSKYSPEGNPNHFVFSYQCTMEENLPEKLRGCWGSIGQDRQLQIQPAMICSTQTKYFWFT